MKRLPLLALMALMLLALAAFFYFSKKQPVSIDPTSQPTVKPSPQKVRPSPLATLGEQPDWSRLDPYQETIHKADFTRLLKEVFIWNHATLWPEFIQIKEDHVAIKKDRTLDSPDNFYLLKFAPESVTQTPPPTRYWRAVNQLPQISDTTTTQVLAGLKIAIDPGHIGGDFAQMEERYFTIENGKPVMEGEMTMKVANLIKPQLEALGATVNLVRSENAPVTSLRSADFLPLAQKRMPVATSPLYLQKLAEKYFYRTAEIRARGKIVNEDLQPDLVLCLHFNAEGWGDPADPTLTENNHLHMILHGGYMDGEIAHDDERFQLVFKLIQRIHSEERDLNKAVVKALAKASSLPPYKYNPNKPAVNIDGNPYLWARNLLANRLYECPVVFLEPYVMNSQPVYDRVQLGDYEGQREINGTMRKSIYREYADGVVDGLKSYYLKNRTPTTP